MRGTCDGLVIKVTEYGESDKLITVLTAEQGQLVMIAKGARSMKNKNIPLCCLFTYANFEFYEKSGRYWLSGGSVSNSFFKRVQDMRGFALASYIVQLAADITGEGVEAESVLQMTLNTLYMIENRLKPYPLIKSVYEAFAASEAGFTPELGCCGVCRKEGADRGLWLDVMNGRLLCGDCLSASKGSADTAVEDAYSARGLIVPIDESAVAAWRYVSHAPLKRIFSFELKNEESVSSFSHASEVYIVNHLERSFKTLEFYNAVKE